MKKIILLLSSLLVVSSCGVNQAKAEGEATYDFGSAYSKAQRLEAEDFVYESSATVLDKSLVKGPYVSGTVAKMEAGAEVRFNINSGFAGEVTLKYAYFSDVSSSSLSIAVNGGEAIASGIDMSGDYYLINGLAEGVGSSLNPRNVFYKNLSIVLAEGNNTIAFKTVKRGFELDFIELYKSDAVYYYQSERQLLGLQEVDERIEAEDGLIINGVTKTASFQSCPSGNSFSNNGGVGLGITTSSAAVMRYLVKAPARGTYVLRIAATGNSGISNTTQTWTINGVSSVYTFNTVPGAGQRCAGYTCFSSYEVTLKKGVNTITFTQLWDSTNIDYFWLHAKHENQIDEIIEAEEFPNGVIRQINKYSPSIGYLPELHADRPGSIKFDMNVPEAGYYDLYVRAFTGSGNAFIDLTLNEVDNHVYRCWNTGYISSGSARIADQVFVLNLKAGLNTFEFKRNGDHVCYDFFEVKKNRLGQINDDPITLKAGQTLDVFDGVATTNPSIAKVENGKVVALKAGSTTLYYMETLGNGYSFERKATINVETNEYTGELAVNDSTVAYDGLFHGLDVTAPAGWKVTYPNIDGAIEVGDYVVDVLFTSDLYYVLIGGEKTNVVRKQATLKINKGTYKGTDLVFESKEFDFDGEAHYLSASCPIGWDVMYADNGRSYYGSHEVTATFVNKNYLDVTKKANITIR